MPATRDDGDSRSEQIRVIREIGVIRVSDCR
jgi:hypothetical protein